MAPDLAAKGENGGRRDVFLAVEPGAGSRSRVRQKPRLAVEGQQNRLVLLAFY